MSRINKRKLKSICFYLISWIVFCFLFVLLHTYGTPSFFDPVSYLTALQFSLLVGLSHGIYDVIILQDDKDHRPIWASCLIRFWYFTSTTIINISLCIFVENWYKDGNLIDENSLTQLKAAFATPQIRAFCIYCICAGFIITFIRSVHKKFGTRVFINTFLGKYQKPTEVQLAFMFVDLRHSTQLAESLGHVQYSNFLKDYYHLLSNCCEENQGEIYQIAGDGVYLTWPLSACKKKPRPLLCFEDLKKCFAGTRARFEREYGTYPTFKGAAHSGKVIMTEVGNFQSEMAYHGDALNTTARLQDLCTQVDEEFLISGDLLTELKGTEIYNPKPKGSFELKGKKKEIFVFSLDFSLDR